MIKLIATDMDGTLLNREHKVSLQNAKAIHSAQKNGIEVIVATGRSYEEAIIPLREAEINCLLICVNGAETWDNSGQLQATNPLNVEDVHWAMQKLREHSIYFELYSSKGTYSDNKKLALDVIVDLLETTGALTTHQEMKKLAQRRVSNGSIQFVEHYEQLLEQSSDPVLKLLAFSTNLKVLDQVEEELGEHKSLSVTASARGNLEINSIYAQKGLAVQAYAQKLGIGLDTVMALGDNMNDLSMMKLVGYPVAMENAAYEVKELCKYETLHHDKNGVAEAIYTYTHVNK
ncbi:HAD family hydrolase [Alkalicoccobacillus porphyridii]|nr:HAD family hydrolase [Alkalicoccobacillus porphyridii]